jgi:AraC-like DNA-binding protein
MPATAADFAPVRFSTHDLPERERLPRWREELGRGLVRVDIEPLSDGPFHAEATLQALPGVRMASFAVAAAKFNRTRALVAEGDDSVGLIVNLGGKAVASQRDKDITLGPGDAVFVLTHEPGVLRTSTHHLGMLLPRAAIASRVTNVDDTAMRVIPHGLEQLRLLVSYLALVRDSVVRGAPGLHRAVACHIHDLAALAIGMEATAEDGLSAVAAARLAAAISHIAQSFTDPSLTLAAVAARQGVSPRYLQRLFETSGMSFMARVIDLRLQKAFALLTGPHARKRRIIDVALQAGFSDVSHFNRHFRSRFGDSPSGVRGER